VGGLVDKSLDLLFSEQVYQIFTVTGIRAGSSDKPIIHYSFIN